MPKEKETNILSFYKLPYLKGKQHALFTLQNCRKINILVGPNNTGKSRFIRALLKQPLFLFDNDNEETNSDFQKNANQLKS